jgi:hypothetical protein
MRRLLYGAAVVVWLVLNAQACMMLAGVMR